MKTRYLLLTLIGLSSACLLNAQRKPSDSPNYKVQTTSNHTPVKTQMLIAEESDEGKKMTFQGSLYKNGEIFNGTVNLKFTIQVDSSRSWTEEHSGVEVADGLYSVVLGTTTPLPADLFYATDEQVLSVKVDETQLGEVTLYAPFETSDSKKLPLDYMGPNGKRSIMLSSEGPEGNDGTVRLSNQEGASRVTIFANRFYNDENDNVVWTGSGGAWFGGANGSMSAYLGSGGFENSNGFLQLGDSHGDVRADLMVTGNGTDSSYFSSGQLRLNDTNMNSARFAPHALYFYSKNSLENYPVGWFGTYGGNGFSQILSFNEAQEYQGGILTGFFTGAPSVYMEDGNENLGAHIHLDQGAGLIDLYGQGWNPNIRLGGKTWENANLPYLAMNGQDQVEGDSVFVNDSVGFEKTYYHPDLVWLEAQKWENGTEVGAMTLRGTDGSELHLNSHGIDFGDEFRMQPDQDGTYARILRGALSVRNDHDTYSSVYLSRSNNGTSRLQLVAHDTASGVATGTAFLGTNTVGPYMYMNGLSADGSSTVTFTDLYTTGSDPWGNPYSNGYKRAGVDFYDNQGHRLSGIGSRKDENGSDPEGAAGLVFLWSQEGNPNVEITGKVWENSKLPILQLFGTTATADSTWYLSNAVMEVNSDGTSEWGNLALHKTDIAGRTSAQMIALDGNTGNVTIAGTLSQSSDVRLKTNIQTLQGALGKVNDLRGVSYQWKDTGLDQSTQIGLIAQEVESIYPEFVKTDEKGMKSVNYAQMTAVLIEAVKALNAQIVTLQQENSELKADVASVAHLSSRLAEIEKLLGVKTSENSSAQNK